MNYGKEFEKFAKSKKRSNEEALKYHIGNVTPYVIEEREMRMTQMDVFSRLMMDRIIWTSGVVNEQMSDIVQAQLLFLEDIDPSKDIKMYLNTPGGSVPHGLGIYDTMHLVKPDIATHNLGMCASMGSVLLAAGTKGKRTSLNYSRVMTHQVSHGTQGNVQDTRISHIEGEKYNFLLFKLLGEHSGKTWKEVLDHSRNDRWYNAVEARDYGFIDEVLVRDGGEPIDVMMKEFSDYKKYIEEN